MANLFQRIGISIRYLITGGIQETKVWGVGTQEVYSTYDQQNAVSAGFNSNAAVYSIVKRYAKKAGSIERYLENTKDKTRVDNSELLKLLNRPNPQQSQDAFLSLVFAFYKVTGEAFIWLNRGEVGTYVDQFGDLQETPEAEYIKKPVLEMYVIPSNLMVLVPGDDPFSVKEYKLMNSPQVKFRKEDIIHWKDINLQWDEHSKPHLRGMTPLKPGSRTLTADNSALSSMVRMFQNDGAKGIAYEKSMRQLTPEQKTQQQQVFSDKVNNKEIKNQVAAFQGDWGYLNLGLTSVDMETIKGREFIYKELCFLLGVPYELFDSQVTYANKAEAQKGWVINEIKPDCMQLDGELNRVLLPAFGLAKGVKICSNFDELPEMQEDKAKQIEWLNKLPLSANQRLEEMGFDPSTEEGMDEVTTAQQMHPVKIEDPALDDAIRDVETMTNGEYAN